MTVDQSLSIISFDVVVQLLEVGPMSSTQLQSSRTFKSYSWLGYQVAISHLIIHKVIRDKSGKLCLVDEAQIKAMMAGLKDKQKIAAINSIILFSKKGLAIPYGVIRQEILKQKI